MSNDKEEASKKLKAAKKKAQQTVDKQKEDLNKYLTDLAGDDQNKAFLDNLNNKIRDIDGYIEKNKAEAVASHSLRDYAKSDVRIARKLLSDDLKLSKLLSSNDLEKLSEYYKGDIAKRCIKIQEDRRKNTIKVGPQKAAAEITSSTSFQKPAADATSSTSLKEKEKLPPTAKTTSTEPKPPVATAAPMMPAAGSAGALFTKPASAGNVAPTSLANDQNTIDEILKMKELFSASMNMPGTDDIEEWGKYNPYEMKEVKEFSDKLMPLLALEPNISEPQKPWEGREIEHPDPRPGGTFLEEIATQKEIDEHDNAMEKYNKEMHLFHDYQNAMASLLEFNKKDRILKFLNKNPKISEFLKDNISSLRNAANSFKDFASKERVQRKQDFSKEHQFQKQRHIRAEKRGVQSEVWFSKTPLPTRETGKLTKQQKKEKSEPLSHDVWRFIDKKEFQDNKDRKDLENIAQNLFEHALSREIVAIESYRGNAPLANKWLGDERGTDNNQLQSFKKEYPEVYKKIQEGAEKMAEIYIQIYKGKEPGPKKPGKS